MKNALDKHRVVAAMSGGVDSAVAAGLLAEAGYDVVGVTMKMYEPTRPAHAKSCCGSDDFDDARRSAAQLGIPHYVLDFRETFRRGVMDRFFDDYANGRTPNPCVACNNFVKLGTLAEYAQRLGAGYIATGHYARIEHAANGPHLFRSSHHKDQAYALAQLTPAQLARLLLPLGEFDKRTTRAHARRLNLPVHDKTESQDICFVEGGDYRDIVRRERPDLTASGELVATDGSSLGRHSGVAHYTIGQRHSLPSRAGAPRYVTHIDAATQTIVLGDAADLYRTAVFATEVNLIRPEHFRAPKVAVRAMVRYRAEPSRATATLEESGLRLSFEEPQRAVAPGQLLAVLARDGDEVLAGATISSAG